MVFSRGELLLAWSLFGGYVPFVVLYCLVVQIGLKSFIGAFFTLVQVGLLYNVQHRMGPNILKEIRNVVIVNTMWSIQTTELHALPLRPILIPGMIFHSPHSPIQFSPLFPIEWVGNDVWIGECGTELSVPLSILLVMTSANIHHISHHRTILIFHWNWICNISGAFSCWLWQVERAKAPPWWVGLTGCLYNIASLRNDICAWGFHMTWKLCQSWHLCCGIKLSSNIT